MARHGHPASQRDVRGPWKLKCLQDEILDKLIGEKMRDGLTGSKNCGPVPSLDVQAGSNTSTIHKPFINPQNGMASI